MAAYLIAEIEVTNARAYEAYKNLTPEAIAAYGGRFLTRGGAVESKEGGWAPQRLVLVEFPSMDAARRFYDSPEYAPALAIRKQAARSKLVLAEGV